MYKEVEAKIAEVEKNFEHVLRGSLATVDINAPRALLQVSAEAQLNALSWVLGREYHSKLKGTNA